MSKDGPASKDYETVDEQYLEKRQLRRGAAGWVLLAGLGVSYVISGDFAGWNFGLAQGGWGGLLIATVLMALMYTCMVFGLAEMASALPVAGAGYGFARRALGRTGGFVTGMAILIEYAIAPAAIAVFIGGYVESLNLFGLTSGWPVFLACYLIFVGAHLWGVGEALRAMFVITGIAVVALVVFVIGMIGKFDPAKLLDIPMTDAVGASSFLPFGIAGALAALVYGIWFFLAIEGVPLAAEEARDPKRDLPRGIIAGMSALLLFAALILVFAPGGAGSAALAESKNPLPDAVRTAFGGDNFLAQFINYVGLAGLVASFFSIVFAYSRQLFALSRAGYLPTWLSRTTSRKTPVWALVVPGAIGFVLATVVANGDALINVAVFG
ncbi:MAG: ethanolamine permease, partial [Kibdelosporangium sp.]